MKGIILAGGSGTRLHPITLATSKQLLPVYDKPMIYYPLSSLIKAGIGEILIITTPTDANNFKNLLGDGSELGCQFEYAIQDKPNGLAEAFLIGKDFIKDDAVCLVLGDNVFYGGNFEESIKTCLNPDGGIIFGYQVRDPRRYGVVEFDDSGKVISIQEKPEKPKSKYAIAGIYFFDNQCIKAALEVKPSPRGELEIVDIHQFYLNQNKLEVKLLNRGTAWLDMGTIDSFNQATDFVQAVEKRQGIKIGCIEEAAYKSGFIDQEQLQKLAHKTLKSGYGQYLLDLLN